MASSGLSPWFQRVVPVAGPRFRLFLFHHAGANASAYFRWMRRFPASWEVLAVELPGRGAHAQRAALGSVDDIADELAAEIASLPPAPFGLFGHSLGALIAYETQHALVRSGRTAARWLGLSAKSAPSHNDSKPIRVHDQSDDVLAHYMLSLGGTPAELLQDPDLRALFLPPFRTDMRLVETYRHLQRPRLSTPAALFGGRADPRVSVEALRSWAMELSSPVDEHLFSGGHFYLHEHANEVVGAIVSSVSRTPSASPMRVASV